MERLIIKDFLVLSEIDIEIKRVNILIGSQGTGKSVIAKVLHFFRGVGLYIERSILALESIEGLKNSLVDQFKKIFPLYAWSGVDFSIGYTYEDVNIRIVNSSNKDSAIQIFFSPSIENAYIDALRKFKNIWKSKESVSFDVLNNSAQYRLKVRGFLIGSSLKKFFQQRNSVFIPSSRSFFSVIKENIFTFLLADQGLDPYLVQFGSVYQSYKRFYNDLVRDPQHTRNYVAKEKGKITIDCIASVTEKIIGGKFLTEDNKDYIVSQANSRVELIHASSGQQEAIPLLIVLMILKILENNAMVFIEEPEAHLFPDAQSQIVSLISTLYEGDQSFFITTHSPYIISTLNNLIYADDLIRAQCINERFFKELFPFGASVKFEDVSAYFVLDRHVESILDEKYRMIKSTSLDKVSSVNEDLFGQLLRKDNRSFPEGD